MTFETHTSGPSDTEQLGERLAKALKGGEVIELASDLGGGKTVFVRGLARGLGYAGEITSPTFTISRVYRLPGDRELHHFDFYRLDREDIVAQELAEVAGDPDVIVAIEWAGNVGSSLPPRRVRVDITADTETERTITVTSLSPECDYVVEALK